MAPADEISLSRRQSEQLFIGGTWVEPATKSMFDVIRFATEELFLRVAEARR